MSKIRYTVCLMALVYTMLTLIALYPYNTQAQTLGEKISVNQQQIAELGRRMDNVEGHKIGEQLTMLKAQIDVIIAKQDERDKLIYGLYIPVGLLAFGKILDLYTKRKEG